LITADTLISDYNQRMTRERAAELRQPAHSALAHIVTQRGFYSATLIHLGQDYLPALTLEQIQTVPFGTVTLTVGGIGTRLGQLKTWLNCAIQKYQPSE
jgi:hypothetical protein